MVWVDSRNNSRIVDNRWVVPYNEFLAMKYECHINVQVCVSVKSIKYLYKYVHKGSDRAMMRVGADLDANTPVQSTYSNPPSSFIPEPEPAALVDECSRYLDARVIGASEAVWRLQKNALFKRHPAVKPLAVHLENMQYCQWQAGEISKVPLRTSPGTTLTSWFEYLRTQRASDPLCLAELYVDFYARHLYTKSTRKKNGHGVTGSF